MLNDDGNEEEEEGVLDEDEDDMVARVGASVDDAEEKRKRPHAQK